MGVPVLRSSISLSLLFHGLFLLICGLMLHRQATNPSVRTTWIEVQPLSPQEKARLREKEQERFRKQIVQTEQGKKVDKAAPDAFLGEKNQVVDRETVSKTRTTAMGESSKPKSNTESAKREAAKPVAQTQPAQILERGKLSSFGIAMPMPEKTRRMDPHEELSEAAPGLDAQGRPQDYVKGLKEGERTALNTREYVFYGYFQRIRERLDRAWVPILREKLAKLYKSGRQLASEMDHSTRVLVVLDKGGEIVRVEITSESGTHDLDEAAVRAFNQAGPFPNPPRGMMNAQGEVQIPWEFILKS